MRTHIYATHTLAVYYKVSLDVVLDNQRVCSIYVCPHTPIYVSSYHYICVLILPCICPHNPIYLSSYYYTCVLMLLYMCHHTTMYVCSNYHICVLIFLYMCPHTNIPMSSYYYMCPHTTTGCTGFCGAAGN
jgi:hypothetical protein